MNIAQVFPRTYRSVESPWVQAYSRVRMARLPELTLEKSTDGQLLYDIFEHPISSRFARPVGDLRFEPFDELSALADRPIVAIAYVEKFERSASRLAGTAAVLAASAMVEEAGCAMCVDTLTNGGLRMVADLVDAGVATVHVDFTPMQDAPNMWRGMVVPVAIGELLQATDVLHR